MGSDPLPPDATQLLRRFDAGDREAGETLLRAVYDDLRALAARHLAKERPDHTLQPTALLHEAWLKLESGADHHFASRGHFLALASRVMRTLLVDHARRKNAVKRGGEGERVALEDLEGDGEPTLDVLELEEALTRLEQVDAELARLIELRYFAGSSLSECAEALGLAQRTAERRLQAATVWLRRFLESRET
jgi:RNA polymerase sigma factor (TIGR02999 family)